MLEFQGRKKSKKKIYGLVALLIFFFLILILIRPTWKIWRKNIRSGEEVKEAEIRLQELQGRQIALSAELENLESREGQEEEIVRKFDVVKEGEQLAIILESEEVEVVYEPQKGFFGRFFDRLFGWLKD